MILTEGGKQEPFGEKMSKGGVAINLYCFPLHAVELTARDSKRTTAVKWPKLIGVLRLHHTKCSHSARPLPAAWPRNGRNPH